MEVNIRALKALAHFCAVNDGRYYLTGVHMERANDGNLIMVATDGMIMGVIRQETDTSDLVGSVIIPKGLINRIKIKKKINTCTIAFEGGGSHPIIVRIEYDGETYMANVLDVTFPSWRHIPPTKPPSFATRQYDPFLMARIGNAMAVLSGRKDFRPLISHNGDGPALVKWIEPGGGIDGFGVIMPFTPWAPFMTEAPAWAAE